MCGCIVCATGVSVQAVLFCCIVVPWYFVYASIARDLQIHWRGSKNPQPRQVYYWSAVAATSTPNTTANRSTQHQREKHGRSLKHSTAQCTQTFRCQSGCSVFALHQSQNVLSCAHRTAPHRTAPHRTALHFQPATSTPTLQQHQLHANRTPAWETSDI